VTPRECAANPNRQSAHGGVTRGDHCKCGAVRYTESNYGHYNIGQWEENDGTE